MLDLTLLKCCGLITTSPLTLIGAGSDINPSKKIILNELQPASSNRIHPWVFPLRWFWLINCSFVLVLLCFVCFVFLFVTSLWGKERAGWEVQQCHRRLWDAARGNGPFNRFFSQQKFAVPAQNVRMMTVSQRHFPSVAELWYETSWFSHERGVNPWKCYFSKVLFEKY